MFDNNTLYSNPFFFFQGGGMGGDGGRGIAPLLFILVSIRYEFCYAARHVQFRHIIVPEGTDVHIWQHIHKKN